MHNTTINVASKPRFPRSLLRVRIYSAVFFHEAQRPVREGQQISRNPNAGVEDKGLCSLDGRKAKSRSV